MAVLRGSNLRIPVYFRTERNCRRAKWVNFAPEKKCAQWRGGNNDGFPREIRHVARNCAAVAKHACAKLQEISRMALVFAAIQNRLAQNCRARVRCGIGRLVDL
jgi:hypothetical protein